jgi:hypothetical protein
MPVELCDIETAKFLNNDVIMAFCLRVKFTRPNSSSCIVVFPVRIVEVLGQSKALDLLHKTEDIEEAGGLKILVIHRFIYLHLRNCPLQRLLEYAVIHCVFALDKASLGSSIVGGEHN